MRPISFQPHQIVICDGLDGKPRIYAIFAVKPAAVAGENMVHLSCLHDNDQTEVQVPEALLIAAIRSKLANLFEPYKEVQIADNTT
jgi:hypothetical protein